MVANTAFEAKAFKERTTKQIIAIKEKPRVASPVKQAQTVSSRSRKYLTSQRHKSVRPSRFVRPSVKDRMFDRDREKSKHSDVLFKEAAVKIVLEDECCHNILKDLEDSDLNSIYDLIKLRYNDGDSFSFPSKTKVVSESNLKFYSRL